MRYTPVTVETTLDDCGQNMPSAIVWKDQKKYHIQRIVHFNSKLDSAQAMVMGMSGALTAVS